MTIRHSLLSTLLLSLIIFSFSSCMELAIKEHGNGNLITEKRSIESFDKITIVGNYTILLSENSSEGITVEADDNLLEYISTRVNGSTLIIENEEKILSSKGITIYIDYTQLKKIDISGACVVKNEEVIKTDDFQLKMSGAGEVDLRLDVAIFELDLSGAGDIELKGVTKTFDVQMSGAGNLDAFDLDSRVCIIDISGVGNANIRAEEELIAKISGVGSVNYKGNPTLVDSNVSGLGNIDRKD